MYDLTVNKSRYYYQLKMDYLHLTMKEHGDLRAEYSCDKLHFNSAMKFHQVFYTNNLFSFILYVYTKKIKVFIKLCHPNTKTEASGEFLMC